MSLVKPFCGNEIEIPNRRIVGAADQYRDAVVLLFDYMKEKNDLVLPVLMNAAFAIELYLKSLNAENVYHDISDKIDADMF